MAHKTSAFRFHGHALLFIVAVAGLLAIPAVIGWIRGNASSTRELENRNMAALPPLQLLRKNAPAYIEQMDAHLKDTIGLRHRANTFYRKLRYFIFHDPPLPNVTIGRGGHTFLNAPRPTTPYAFFESLCLRQGSPAPREVHTLSSTLGRISGYLQRQGIRATFAIAPSTLSLYAETLPLRVPPAYRRACLAYPERDHLLARLQRQGEESGHYRLFYPYELFARHKGEEGFYPKERYHWEGKSAYLFARHLVQASGALTAPRLDDPASLTTVPDDIATFFGFARTITGYTYAYDDQTSTVQPVPWIREFSQRGQLTLSTTENSLHPGTALLIANSFGIALAPHLARCFRQLYFLDLNLLQKNEQQAVFAALIERTRPDYVFFVFDDVNAVHIPQRLAGFIQLEALARQKTP